MAKVFGSSQSCNSGGITRVLPTSSESLQTTQTQTFSSSPNIYSKSQPSSGDLNLRDFYNKSDIHRLLKLKADISSIYSKSDIDLRFSSLQSQFNASITEFITESETDVKILNLYNTIVSEIGNSYYQKSFLYTKSEIDSLLEAIPLGDEFISLEPETTLRNTINPGSNNAVPLSIKASSNPNITTVQHWINSQSNSIGRVRTSGRVEFYGDMILGQNVESWKPALDVNMRRISGVANPTHVFDAVNKKYMEDFIIEVIDNISQGEDKSYIVDALEYGSSQDPPIIPPTTPPTNPPLPLLLTEDNKILTTEDGMILLWE